MLNTKLLYDKLLDRPDLKGINIRDITIVAIAVVELLSDPTILNTVELEDIL